MHALPRPVGQGKGHSCPAPPQKRRLCPTLPRENYQNLQSTLKFGRQLQERIQIMRISQFCCRLFTVKGLVTVKALRWSSRAGTSKQRREARPTCRPSSWWSSIPHITASSGLALIVTLTCVWITFQAFCCCFLLVFIITSKCLKILLK